MQQVTVEQRRRHLARRQYLARPAEDVHEVARDLCGLHSSDAASVLLAARARVRDFVPADAEVALYDDRSLARVLGMRRTMFVVPTEDVALVHAAATADLLGRETRRLVGMLADSDVTDGADPAAWLARVSDATVEALHDLGPATATELTAVVPELGRKVTIAPETRWGGQFGVSTRVLFLLATEGRIVRGRPRGSWLSTQYRWAATDTWFDGRVDLDAWEPADAHVELARRWLRAFGPATADDLRWWAGWTKGRTRTALAALRPTEVDLGGTPGLLAPGDELDDGPVDPWVALLPSLDSTIMGWSRPGPRPRPRAAPRPVRPQRQRRSDGVGRRAGGRRMGPAPRRRGRHPPAGRRRPRRRRGGRGRGGRADGLAGRHPGHGTLPDTPREGAVRVRPEPPRR